jgi:hypothetical protein
MPCFIEFEFDEHAELPANCPQSLEGRLLFAVPKSESPSEVGGYELI